MNAEQTNQINLLGEKWIKVADRLKQLALPREVWVIYEEGVTSKCCFGLLKFKGKWCVCHGHIYAGEVEPAEWRPVTECSIDERIDCVGHLELLRQAIISKGKESVIEVDQAVSDLDKFLTESEPAES